MSVETVGQFKKVLDNYSGADWVKSDGAVDVKGNLNPIGLEESLGPINKTSFAEMLASSVSEVNGLQKDANTAIQKLVSGESKNLHETMLAVEKAEVAFKAMNQIRMKVIDAYKEIMRMQV
jgi:flagellar hook-basal body complex protein FliE